MNEIHTLPQCLWPSPFSLFGEIPGFLSLQQKKVCDYWNPGYLVKQSVCIGEIRTDDSRWVEKILWTVVELEFLNWGVNIKI